MKILLTTDFTIASDHANKYAIRLFSEFEGKKKYYLFHAFKPEAPFAGASGIPVAENYAWKTEEEERLIKTAEEMQQNYNEEIEPLFVRGGVYESIHQVEKENDDWDLVVMATREKSLFERITLGSNALQVAEKATTTSLIIPMESKIKKPEHIAFTTDLRPFDVDHKSFSFFKKLINTYQPKLDVVHVYQSEKEKTDSLDNSEIHQNMRDLEHDHVSIINESIFEGIHEYMDQNKPDMLVIIPRERSFFQKVFKQTITSEMTYHSNIPLLILK